MICEYCGAKQNGSYGSGRFCNRSCANGFSTKEKRKEINKKVSISLAKKEKRFNKFYIISYDICSYCYNVFYKKNSKRKFCNIECKKLFDQENEKDYFKYKILIDDNNCWIWQGKLLNNGYGSCKGSTSHRKSYIYYKGPIKKGKVVRHMCNNKLCCNPDHLEIGTQQDNYYDIPESKRKEMVLNRKLSIIKLET